MRCCNRKEHQIFKLDGRQKREASREKLLEMPAPSSVYVSGLSPSQHRRLLRQKANGQHDAGTGRLHCDLCSVFCMKDCVTILVMSPAASSSVGWSSGSSVVSAEGKDPTLQQPPSQRPVKRLRL